MLVSPIAFFFIPFEDDRMRRQFGEQYEEYRRGVRRWGGRLNVGACAGFVGTYSKRVALR